MRHLFYVRESGGYFTNLQMYAYRAARQAWDDLNAEYARHGAHTEQLREKCVLAVATLGLSISQLLGQNNPNPRASDVPSPQVLFKDFVSEHKLDARLIPRFNRFVDYYDAIRHFGVSDDDSKYALILQLDYETTRECFDTGIEIWRQVVQAYSRTPGSRLDDFRPEVHPPDEDEFYFDDDDAL